MWTIRVEHSFSAAHQIHEIGGKCENVHGHNYRVEVAIPGSRLKKPGMVADFVEVREKLASILPDHRMLNEVYGFSPTSEHLARRFFEDMSRFYTVKSVRVWEDEGRSAEYSRD